MRTFIVLLEMDADEVIVNVFEALFNVVRCLPPPPACAAGLVSDCVVCVCSNDHSSKAKSHMVDIMNSLIEESEGLSQVRAPCLSTPVSVRNDGLAAARRRCWTPS